MVLRYGTSTVVEGKKTSIRNGRVEVSVLLGTVRRIDTPFHIISDTTVLSSPAKYLAIIAKSSPDGQLTFDITTVGKIGGVRPGFPPTSVSVRLVVKKRAIPLIVVGHGLDYYERCTD